MSLQPDTLDWALQIQRVSRADAGRYECQATTHPPQSIVIRLKVVGERGMPQSPDRGRKGNVV